MTKHFPIPPARYEALSSGSERICGITITAQAVGLPADTTRRLAARARVPIYLPDERRGSFAVRAELIAWLRQKAS
jgi:RNase H-fold protein (predicted Holliday junction resolvase)